MSKYNISTVNVDSERTIEVDRNESIRISARNSNGSIRDMRVVFTGSDWVVEKRVLDSDDESMIWRQLRTVPAMSTEDGEDCDEDCCARCANYSGH